MDSFMKEKDLKAYREVYVYAYGENEENEENREITFISGKYEWQKYQHV